MKQYIIYLFCTLFGMTLIKIDDKKMYFSLSKSNFNFSIGLKTFMGMTLYMIGFLLWINILKNNKLTYILPITLTILNICSVLIGIFYFKEQISLKIVIGIFISIIGIIIINY